MNIINFLKRQKLLIFLIFALLILLFLKYFLQRSSPLKTKKESPILEKGEDSSKYPLDQGLPHESVCPNCKPSITPPEEKKETEGALKEVTQDEFLHDPVGEAMQQALEDKPWLLNFPVLEKNYSIDYLGEEIGFRILMKIDISSSLSREEQIGKIKIEAPEKIKSFGVDLSKEEIYYTFTP